MSQLDPFNPMGQFFQDEFIYNEENERQSNGPPQQSSGLFAESCSECGRLITFTRNSSVVTCPHCGTDFSPNWSRLR